MSGIVAFWVDAKIWLVWALGLSRDALHIHLGLALLLGAAILLRRRPDDWRCWLVVLLFELVNEGVDALAAMRDGNDWLADGGHDVLNTMLWPTMILMFGRHVWPAAGAPADAD